MKKEPEPKLYVWEGCVNIDYTGGDLCIIARNIREARTKADKAWREGVFHTDRWTVETQRPWHYRKPDRVLKELDAVHASSGGS